jgi:hypothetical protein
MMDALLAHRTDQQPSYTATPTRSDDQKIGADRSLEQGAGGTFVHRNQLDRGRSETEDWDH